MEAGYGGDRGGSGVHCLQTPLVVRLPGKIVNAISFLDGEMGERRTTPETRADRVGGSNKRLWAGGRDVGHQK